MSETGHHVAQAPPTDARRSLWRALVKPGGRQVLVGLLLAAVGFGAVLQVRIHDQENSYTGYRQQDLIDILSGLAGTTQRTEAEIDRLEDTRSQLLDETNRRQAALTEARNQVETLTVLAGLAPVTGPGIRVTITEDVGRVRMNAFLNLVEELRTAGAEAIEVNQHVRIVASSHIDNGVGGLLVDGVLVESPLVVEAIGEPGTLAGAVAFARGPQSQLEADGLVVEVEQLDTIDIDSVRDQ